MTTAWVSIFLAYIFSNKWIYYVGSFPPSASVSDFIYFTITSILRDSSSNSTIHHLLNLMRVWSIEFTLLPRRSGIYNSDRICRINLLDNGNRCNLFTFFFSRLRFFYVFTFSYLCCYTHCSLNSAMYLRVTLFVFFV